MLGVKGNLTPNPSPKGEGSSEGEKQSLIVNRSTFIANRSPTRRFLASKLFPKNNHYFEIIVYLCILL